MGFAVQFLARLNLFEIQLLLHLHLTLCIIVHVLLTLHFTADRSEGQLMRFNKPAGFGCISLLGVLRLGLEVDSHSFFFVSVF